MYLEKSQLINTHTKNTFINNLDILQITSLIEYNLSYAIAFLISQDNSLVKPIIATHNKVEDKCGVLLNILKDDPLAQEDSSYNIYHAVLTNIEHINSDTLDIIKTTSQLYQTYPNATNILQDISKILSLMFKSTVDAYIQQDSSIAKKSLEFIQQLDALLLKISHIMGNTVSQQLKKIISSVTKIQNTIIETYSTET